MIQKVCWRCYYEAAEVARLKESLVAKQTFEGGCTTDGQKVLEELKKIRLKSGVQLQDWVAAGEIKVDPKVTTIDWANPTDDDLDTFCRSLDEKTRMRLYRHLHSLGCRL